MFPAAHIFPNPPRRDTRRPAAGGQEKRTLGGRLLGPVGGLADKAAARTLTFVHILRIFIPFIPWTY